MPAGGVGHSWFEVELTSEHVCIPGEGGVGHSWFCLELTSEHVPDESSEPPVRPPSPGPVPRVRRRTRLYEERFDGRYTIVETVVQRFPGRYVLDKEGRFAGTFTLLRSDTQVFSATYRSSTLRWRQREDEIALMLMMEDDV